MSAFVVRPATREDTEKIVTLWQAMSTRYAALDPRLVIQESDVVSCKRSVNHWIDSPNSHLLVADREGECIGYILGVIDEVPMLLPRSCGIISDIGVDGYAHQSGIGSALLDGLLPWFVEQPMTWVEIRVPQRHPISQAFWRSKGAVDYFDHLRLKVR